MSAALLLAKAKNGNLLGGSYQMGQTPRGYTPTVYAAPKPSASLTSFLGGLGTGIEKVGTAIGTIGTIFNGGSSLPIPSGAVPLGSSGLIPTGTNPATGMPTYSLPSGSGGGAIGTGMGGAIHLPGGITIGGGISLAGAAGGGSFAPTGSAGTAVMACAPRGYHLNKRGYYTQHGYIAPHSKLVRNRRRNDLNGRALTRALGRVEGYEHIRHRVEKALVKIARGHAPKHRGSFGGRGKKCGCK